MHSKILVTGATGVLGREIVKLAAEAGLAVRQAVRDPAKALPTAEAIHFDYADPSTTGASLDGISGLVLMAPPP